MMEFACSSKLAMPSFYIVGAFLFTLHEPWKFLENEQTWPLVKEKCGLNENPHQT
jgi:hypothetical protein